MELPSLLSVTPIYIAILGLMFIPFTLRVGLYRVKNDILLGDGGDQELIRRMRAQANFIETVPMALFLLIMVEVLGASDTWLHSLGALLVFGRTLHWFAMTEIGPSIGRPIGMVSTMAVIIVSSVWILVDVFA